MRFDLFNVLSSRKSGTVAVLAGACVMALAGSSHAATYYLQEDHQTGGHTISETGQWFDQVSGGGNNPAGFNDNDFDSNGFIMRTSNGNFTFGNAGTTLSFNSTLIVRTDTSDNGVIPNLISYGTSPLIRAGAGNAAVKITNFANAATTELRANESAPTRLYLTMGTLDGSGNFVLSGGSASFIGTVHLNITDASAFTGSIGWKSGAQNTSLNFDNDLVSGGGLVVPGNGFIVLDQDVTFTSASINGVDLTPGLTYSYSDLKSTFGSIFVDVDEENQGSITVVPEPGGLLAAAGALLVMARRRRH